MKASLGWVTCTDIDVAQGKTGTEEEQALNPTKQVKFSAWAEG